MLHKNTILIKKRDGIKKPLPVSRSSEDPAPARKRSSRIVFYHATSHSGYYRMEYVNE